MTLADIPVINYHKIEPDSDIGLTSRHPDRFERDLDLIAKEGFQTITFSDVDGEDLVPDNSLIITFDDAYESTYTHALPRMLKYGFKGVVYVPAAYIGKTNDWDVQFAGKKYRHLNDEQIRELLSNCFELGSHGLSHRLLRSLDKAEMIAELVQSKAILEHISKMRVLSISYPFGRYNQRILSQTAEAGYRYGVGAIRFHRPEYVNQKLSLNRFNIYRHDSDSIFLKKITGRYHSPVALRDWLIQKGGLATAFYQEFFMTKKNSINYNSKSLKTKS
jgi:peptidoglycan/xylan/chitin deacetylase (PgdA/CDA1 family)